MEFDLLSINVDELSDELAGNLEIEVDFTVLAVLEQARSARSQDSDDIEPVLFDDPSPEIIVTQEEEYIEEFWKLRERVWNAWKYCVQASRERNAAFERNDGTFFHYRDKARRYWAARDKLEARKQWLFDNSPAVRASYFQTKNMELTPYWCDPTYVEDIDLMSIWNRSPSEHILDMFYSERRFRQREEQELLSFEEVKPRSSGFVPECTNVTFLYKEDDK